MKDEKDCITCNYDCDEGDDHPMFIAMGMYYNKISSMSNISVGELIDEEPDECPLWVSAKEV